MFGYFCHQYLCDLERKFEVTSNNKYGESTYGHALRYGKYAVVYVVSELFSDDLDTLSYKEYVKEMTNKILDKWMDFEMLVSTKLDNSDYFYQLEEDGKINIYYNFDGYYKGKTINYDIRTYDFEISDADQEAAATCE